MIPAAKQPLFNAWFAAHARSRIHGAFARLRVRGLARARELCARGPLLIVSNHTSWWDPLVILHASQHLLEADGHALMDARNLRRLPFFAMVGGFGVDLSDPEDRAAAVEHAAALLDRPRRLVWIFPQGRERPITERPLGFRSGAAEVARRAPAAVTLPAALRYEHAGTERPDLYLSFGAPVPVGADRRAGREAQELAVAAEMDAVDSAVRGQADLGFEDLFQAPRGDDLATRALSFLTGLAGGRPARS